MSNQSARRLRLGHQHQVGSTHLRRGQLQEEHAALHAHARRVCARKEDFRDSCCKRRECATARGSQSVSNSKAAAPPPFVQRCLVCQLTQTHPKAVKAVLAGRLVGWWSGWLAAPFVVLVPKRRVGTFALLYSILLRTGLQGHPAGHLFSSGKKVFFSPWQT